MRIYTSYRSVCILLSYKYLPSFLYYATLHNSVSAHTSTLVFVQANYFPTRLLWILTMTTHSNVNVNYFHKKGIAKVFQFSSDAGMMENSGFGPPHSRGIVRFHKCRCYFKMCHARDTELGKIKYVVGNYFHKQQCFAMIRLAFGLALFGNSSWTQNGSRFDSWFGSVPKSTFEMSREWASSETPPVQIPVWFLVSQPWQWLYLHIVMYSGST